MNEEGEVVTDLAYRNCFDDLVKQQGNPFDTSVASTAVVPPVEATDMWNTSNVSIDFTEGFEPAGMS